MAVTEQDIATVSELTEAECREVMAELASTLLTWETRHVRAELKVEIQALLDAWNTLNDGTEPAGREEAR